MNFYDIDYVTNLRNLARKYLNSSDVVLFSVDGCGNEYLRNGKIPGKASNLNCFKGYKHPILVKTRSHFGTSLENAPHHIFLICWVRVTYVIMGITYTVAAEG